MKEYFDFKYSRQSLGVFIVFMGNPLIFFFKEVLGFGGSSVFTIFSLVMGLVLMIAPEDIFRKFWKPNIPITRLAFYFLFLAFVYYLFFNPYFGFFSENIYVFYRDLGNFIFIFVFLFLLVSVSNEIKDYFLPIVVIFTFFGSICLIYSMATNPYFVIGQRATVVFGDGTTTSSGNPHVYARNAFAGIYSSYFLLKQRSFFWKILSSLNLILSGVVLILAQARSILLAFLFSLMLFVYFNTSKKTIQKAVSVLIKPRNLLMIAFVIWLIIYFISSQPHLVNIINLYYETFLTTFTKAMLTAFGMVDEENVDLSAMGRINNLEVVKKTFIDNPWLFLFGGGFKYFYIDIPVLETLTDLGVLGFLAFSLMNLMIFIEALKAMKSQNNTFTMFLGYFYLTYFVGIFTGGEPFGTAYWFIFAVMMRFLGIKYFVKTPVAVKNPYTEPSPQTPLAAS
ncbi:hypothetical protein [Arcicella rigui]|uniref:Uncharacterized protein n=1 Tax=Arcicella rigui TaxID=797020 RepID=A0ABU5QAP6_9BACT|nr:hypothetical protein [Arcicella rigui]MEA5139808.1 hypothetical protein [Arcicella rigui]